MLITVSISVSVYLLRTEFVVLEFTHVQLFKAVAKLLCKDFLSFSCHFPPTIYAYMGSYEGLYFAISLPTFVIIGLLIFVRYEMISHCVSSAFFHLLIRLGMFLFCEKFVDV